MKIRIRTKTMNLSLPVPVSAAGMVIRKIPDSVFKGLQKNVPEPYSAFCSREALLFLVRECADASHDPQSGDYTYRDGRRDVHFH